MSSIENLEIKELPGSEIELIGELPADQFSAYWKPAVVRLQKDTEVDGFRKGHVPEAVVVEKLGEHAVLEEMAVMAVETIYQRLLKEKNIDAIGRPELTITKLAKDNALGFSIKTAIAPQVTLPDYTTLAREVAAKAEDPVEPTEDEVTHILHDLRKRGRENAEEKDLPALDDTFAQSLGSFGTLEELTNKIKENIRLEKTERNKQKKRIALLDAIVEKTSITLPRLLIDRETDQMLAELEYNIERMGLNFSEYLERTKKSAPEIKKESEPSAGKRIKAKLLLKKIGEAENVVVSEEEINKEVSAITEHYKDVNPERAALYAQDVLRDEKVFKLLENIN